MTLNPANNLSITKTGTATHVAYVNGAEVLFVTDIAGQAVTQGGTANLTGVQLGGGYIVWKTVKGCAVSQI